MSKLAKDVMTPNPQCCTVDTPLNEVAKLMVECDCGEIPVVDSANCLTGVITDRDIVCRVVAKGKDASSMTAADIMTQPVVSVKGDTALAEVLNLMEDKQIRRVPVTDQAGCVCGIIAQADVALAASDSDTGELVREVSRGAVTH
jgi:CBS domain-containing protein